MRFTQVVNKKLLSAIALAFLLWVSAGSASAQQQTGQVAPPTRNPQTNKTELFKQTNNNLQATTPQQLLTQQTSIEIPKGVPAQPDAEVLNKAAQRKRNFWLAISGIGVIIGAGIFIWSNRVSTPPPSPKAKVKPAQPKTDATVVKPPQQNKTHSKKKKSRKKRKKK